MELRRTSGRRATATTTVTTTATMTAAMTAVALLLMATGAPALAQESATELRRPSVLERPRPDYDARGARMGGFMLLPQLAVSERYDDNIFSREQQEESDFITAIEPSVNVQSGWSRHALRLYGNAEILRYADNTAEDVENYAVGGGGRLDIRRQTTLDLDGSYRLSHEDRGSPDAVAGEEPTEYSLTSGRAMFRRGLRRISLSAGADFRYFDYKDVATGGGPIINNDDRDRLEIDPTVRIAYELMPEYSAFVEGGWIIRSYDQVVDDNGFRRDSDGYKVKLGTSLDLGGKLSGEIYAGWLSQDPDDATLKTIDGVIFGTGLLWNVSQLTSLRATVDRTVEETTEFGSAGYLSTRARLGVEHELRRNVLVSGFGSFVNNNYEQITRDDDLLEGGINVKYLLSRNFDVGLDYRITDRNSNILNQDYTKNVVMLRLTGKI